MLKKLKEKIDRKGYMIVEIIVAAVIAIGVGYYLIDLTFHFSDRNEDLNHSTVITAEKTAVTKSIMEDLNNRTVKEIRCQSGGSVSSCNLSDEIIITFEDDTPTDNSDNPRAKLKAYEEDRRIEYGLIDDTGNYDIEDESYYTKTFSSDVVLDGVRVDTETTAEGGANSSVVYINIPLTTNYDDNDYSVRLLVNEYANRYNPIEDQVVPNPPTPDPDPSSPDSDPGSSVEEPEPCVVDVSSNNTTNSTTSNHYFYGWNWGYNQSYNGGSGYSFCNIWGAYNPWCGSTQNTETSTTNNCEEEVSYSSYSVSPGFTYITKFKLDSVVRNVTLFGDDNSSSGTTTGNGGFSGFEIDSDGKLVANFNGEQIESENNSTVITENKWYVIASVFEYGFTTSTSNEGAITGFGFNSSYTFYLFDGSECEDRSLKYNDKICYWNTSFSWNTGANSNSTSGSSFSVNSSYSTKVGEASSNVNTGVKVTDALFYFKAFDRNIIHDYFGTKREGEIDITSNDLISKPLFYYKDHS